MLKHGAFVLLFFSNNDPHLAGHFYQNNIYIYDCVPTLTVSSVNILLYLALTSLTNADLPNDPADSYLNLNSVYPFLFQQGRNVTSLLCWPTINRMNKFEE